MKVPWSRRSPPLRPGQAFVDRLSVGSFNPLGLMRIALTVASSIRVGLCLIVLGDRPEAAAVPALALEGTATWGTPDTPDPWVYRFQIRLQDRRWEIRLEPTRTPIEDARRYFRHLAAGDENTVYIVTERTSDKAIKQVVPAPPPSPNETGIPNTLHISVHTNGVPSEQHMAAAVWLAFASHGHLAGLKPGDLMSTPFSEGVISGNPINSAVAHWYQEATWWKKLPGSWGVPALLHMAEDGELKWYVGMQVRGRGERYPAPFDKGFTNIVYEVIETRDFDGWRVPWRARLSLYLLKSYWGEWLDPQTGFFEAQRVNIQAERIRTHNDPIILPPPIRGVAMVNDHRVRFEGRQAFVTYATTNRILALEELPQARLGPYSAWELAQGNWSAVARGQRLAKAEARQARRAVTYRWILITSSLALALAIGWALYSHRISPAGRTSGHKPPLS